MSDDSIMAEEEDDGLTLKECPACGMSPAWFSLEGLDEGCSGNGFVNCYCGGDQCVCHNHGEMECPGCDDCQEDADDDSYLDDPNGFCEEGNY